MYIREPLFICILTKNILMDAAYAEQRALVAFEQRLFATFSPEKK